jgi:acyl-CoA synthetase (NDP forming)
MQDPLLQSLRSAIDPQSIAIIGASDDPNKIGGRPIHYMLRHGYRGRIMPINPNRATIQGLEAWPSLEALPQAPELAIIAVAGEATVQAIETCARMGVGTAVIIASGFGETGPEGRAVQQHMVDVARASGMRIVGPNTQGLANFGNGAIANFSTLFTEIAPMDGPVAIASQSGGMSQVIYGLVRNKGIGVRHVHATGNEADMTVSDIAWAVVHDPDVKLLLMYMESIANPALLARAAAVARERDLPIVALKAGRTASGKHAASSHTGSQPNDDLVIDAFLRQHGIWRVNDPYQLALSADAYLKGWRPAGRRLVVISNSGASCVLGADASEALDLPIATLSPQTREAVASKLPGFATSTNPIDLTAALLQNSRLFGDVLPIIADDPTADLFFINIPVSGAGYDVAAFARDTAAFEKATGKPVAVAVWQEPIARVFAQAGVCTYPDETDALGVFAQLAGHTALMRREPINWTKREVPDLPSGNEACLSQTQSLQWLAMHGIRVDDPSTPADKLTETNHAPDSPSTSALPSFRIDAHLDPHFGIIVRIGVAEQALKQDGHCKPLAVLVAPFGQAEMSAALRASAWGSVEPDDSGRQAMVADALGQLAVQAGQLIWGAQGRLQSAVLDPVLITEPSAAPLVCSARITRLQNK